MSDKFFFKGRLNKKPKHVSHSFKTDRQVRLGSKESPINIRVQSDARGEELLVIAQQNKLVVKITVDDSQAEDLTLFNSVLEQPKTVILEKTPGRNDICLCGSQRKYKKCCGK